MILTGGDATLKLNFGRTGQSAWIYRPRLNTGTSQGIIWCHANGQTVNNAREDFTVVEKFLSQLTEAGYTVAVPSCGDDSVTIGTTSGPRGWGNSNSRASIEDARVALDALPNVDATKVVVMGLSMGGSTMLAYACSYPTKVHCLVGFIPAPSINTIYSTYGNNPVFSIPDAWGITHPAALPSLATFTDKTELQGIPARFYCHNDDGLAVNSLTDSQALCTWMGGDTQAIDMGTGNHVPTIIDEVTTERILSFIISIAPPRP